MRKRTAASLIGTVTASVFIIILAGACGRKANTPDSPKGDTPMSVAVAPPMLDRAAIAPNREAMASPGLAAAVANEGRGTASEVGDARVVTLGMPIPPLDPSGAMLIRNGQASVEVTRLDDAVSKLRQTASQLGGFVANMSIAGGDDQHRSASLEIRVPSAQFDAVVSALGALGKVESVAATVQDVGDEYVDLGARAANARHMEARLVELLAGRTGKLSDVLTVEQELRRVREEIERYQARLTWLARRTSLSSIQIALHEPTSVLDRRGPSPIADAFAQAWLSAVGVLAWCIASLGVVVPLGVLVGGAIMIGRRAPRFARRNTAVAEAP